MPPVLRGQQGLQRRQGPLQQEPQEQPYGIECALRAPFGNHSRITERTDERPVDDRDIRRWSAS